MMRLVSQVMVAPLLVGGPRRYLITSAYGIAGILAGALWLLVPFALWRSYGMGWTLFWLLPTTIAIFAVAINQEEEEVTPQLPTVWPEIDEDEEVDCEADLPEGYHDWLAEIMQPPPRWYRAAQWTAIVLFTTLFAAAVLEQWFLWMIVMVELIDPWAVVFGVTIAAFQMLWLIREKPRKVSRPLP